MGPCAWLLQSGSPATPGGRRGWKTATRRLVMKKDYYLILRLTPEATEREIRSAYRRLAIELHPDRSGLNSDPFLELQEAYSVLSDPTRRAVYDREAQEVQIQRAAVASRTGSSFRRRHA